MRSSLLWLWLVAALAPQAPARPAPRPAAEGTALIAGVVTDAATNKPIAGALVSIATSATGAGSIGSVLTASDGRFLFVGLRAGAYQLLARKGGYLSGVFGPAQPGGGGSPVDVAADERRTDVKIVLTRPATVSGTIFNEVGEPVINATVTLLSRGRLRGRPTWQRASQGRMTDDRGAFRISGLPPGDFVVLVEQVNASVPTAILDEIQKQQATRRPGDDGSSMSDEVMLSGASGVGPGTARAQLIGGAVLTLSESTTQPFVNANGTFVYPATYYPASLSTANASVVSVRSGEERSGINITLVPVKTIAISGTAAGPDGPLAFTRLSLVSSDVTSLRVSPGSVSTLTDGKGAFLFPAVPRGEYTMRAMRVPNAPTAPMVRTTVQNADGSTSSTGSAAQGGAPLPLPADPTLWVEMPVSAGDRDITSLSVTARTGAHISGRVIFDGGTDTPPPYASVRLSIFPLNYDLAFPLPVARVDATGAIASQGFASSDYQLSIQPPLPGWSLASITTGGVDVSQVPLRLGSKDIDDLVVTFTKTPSVVSGLVTNATGANDTAATVIVFPSDEQVAHDYGFNPRRVVSARTGATGRYTISGLPAGDYLLAAVDAARATDLSPELIESLRPRAHAVRVVTGSAHTVDLTRLVVK